MDFVGSLKHHQSSYFPEDAPRISTRFCDETRRLKTDDDSNHSMNKSALQHVAKKPPSAHSELQNPFRLVLKTRHEWTWQPVWPLTLFFLLPFCKRSITTKRGNFFFLFCSSQQLPRLHSALVIRVTRNWLN